MYYVLCSFFTTITTEKVQVQGEGTATEPEDFNYVSLAFREGQEVVGGDLVS